MLCYCVAFAVAKSGKIAKKLKKGATKTIKHAGAASIAGTFMAVAAQVVYLLWGIEDPDEVMYYLMLTIVLVLIIIGSVIILVFAILQLCHCYRQKKLIASQSERFPLKEMPKDPQ